MIFAKWSTQAPICKYQSIGNLLICNKSCRPFSNARRNYLFRSEKVLCYSSGNFQQVARCFVSKIWTAPTPRLVETRVEEEERQITAPPPEHRQHLRVQYLWKSRGWLRVAGTRREGRSKLYGGRIFWSPDQKWTLTLSRSPHSTANTLRCTANALSVVESLRLTFTVHSA